MNRLFLQLGLALWCAAMSLGAADVGASHPGEVRERSDVIVGTATSMQKILPRGTAAQVQPVRDVAISLARNEKESFQVLVLPRDQPLSGVHLRVSDLRAQNGNLFAATNVAAVTVGYVETKSVPPYGSAQVGWWPDPILDFLQSADIAAGDVQAFWVRVRAPRDQQPGNYVGTLEVLAGEELLSTLNLSVEVYSFAVPVRSPLPLAITFSPGDHPMEGTQAQQAAWRQTAEYPVNAWRQQRLAWGDFLADYYLTYDSLYGQEGWAPDFEILQRLHERGQLGMFNLGYYGILGDAPEAVDAWKKNTLARIKDAYDKAKSLGLLDHAYIYGCDEHPADQFPGVERAAAEFKRACPGALVMTTTYDHSFGTDSVIKSMDAFCPLTPRFDQKLAAQARAAGKQVWWYICCGPHHPHANMFIEYPAIDGRVLKGAQTAKYRPDGFLYYQISIWNSQRPITAGPFTDWDPRSWTTYHGDGSWTCVGPGGSPLATIRLENFRDGLEDYAYVRTLESLVEQVAALANRTAQQDAWLTQAREALVVPDELAKSMTEFTSDPAVVYSWRARLARAIQESGIAPRDP
jgi:hypothetical protein